MTTNVFNRGQSRPNARCLSSSYKNGEVTCTQISACRRLSLGMTLHAISIMCAQTEKRETDKRNWQLRNCSVTWKLGKTWDEYKDDAYDMVNAYMNTFYQPIDRYTVEDLALEMSFYVWLYGDESNESQMRDVTEKDGSHEIATEPKIFRGNN